MREKMASNYSVILRQIGDEIVETVFCYAAFKKIY